MRIFLILGLALFLSGCGTFERLLVKPEIVDRPPLVLPDPMPAQQLPIEWIVITQDNLDEKLAEIQKKNGTITIIALTPEGYQNLSLNVAELRRYIKQQDAVIKAMKQYYERSNESQK